MEEEEEESRRRREVGVTKKKKKIVEKVGEVVNSIKDAKQVDQIICALHSLALLLFPKVDSLALSGCIDHKYRDQVLSAKAPSEDERSDWWNVFYQGAAFPTLARVLLYDVASNWLACFPFAARKHVYDLFFVNGCATEVVQTLVPCLQQSGTGSIDITAVCSNAERLLVLCLLDNNGVLHMAREFGGSSHSHDLSNGQLKPVISRVSQLVTCLPDKARLGAPKSLSSHFFFKKIAIQLLAGAEDWDMNLCDKTVISNNDIIDDTILFVGESFARICRRGSADVLLSVMIPHILQQVQSFVLSSTDLVSIGKVFDSTPGLRFWSKMMEAIKDPYAVERMSELLLHQLATEHASDVEAYWILWILFHRLCEHQTTVRFMFVEKFLLWKVFPVCCLRWILQFTVLECPPDGALLKEGHSNHAVIDTIQRLVTVWSKREFVQSAPMEQQAYITAAVGLSLEKMSKEELNAAKDAMHLILQGVSCRLESPHHLVRRMAGSIALVFSKVIDPNNPLYLDDSCTGEIIDWDFGLATAEKGILEKGSNKVKGSTSLLPEKEFNNMADDGMSNDVKGRKKKISEFKLIDPDEIVDPATLNNESVSDEEDDDNDDASENSETSTDSSLQPYDLADDDTDLKRKFSQLVDVVGALRKSDDADGVERALDVVEKLVRASPDELMYTTGDLVRTLVQVRCSDSTIEGEEEPVEEKRQKALVALIVFSPLGSLDTLNKLLYSPNIDVSQRIMILDVMTNAALELADSRTVKPKNQPRPIISTISDTQPWFVPSSVGPPGAGSWKEISRTDTPLNWSYSYERELPSKPGQIKGGKSRRWSLRAASRQENPMELSQNKFPQYAAAFMLPSMQGFDKKRHGVDLLGRDFIVLGKLIYMLGVCMKCAAMHPEASALALPLMDMLSSREICHHVEAYIRRSVLFAASCTLVALHPSYVASALVEGNPGISKGLEWIRTWALHVAESDTDRECYTMATTCLQLHAEMALQASRALESTESSYSVKSAGLPSNLLKGTIKIPYSNVELLS